MELIELTGLVAAVIVAVLTFLIFFLSRKGKTREENDVSENNDRNTEVHNELENENEQLYKNILDTSLDEKIVDGGNTGVFDWSQNENELEVIIPLGDIMVLKKAVNVTITSKHITVEVSKQLLIDDDLYDLVVPDECSWQLSDTKTGRNLEITLFKKTPTVRNQHWKSVTKSGETIASTIDALGPPVHFIDANNPNSVKESIEKVRFCGIF